MVNMADPRSTTMKTGVKIFGPGKILAFTSGETGVDLTVAGKFALGISAGESERAAGGDLKTAAGATVSYYPLGGVLMVQSVNGITWEEGDIVYAGNSGLATSSNGSSAKLLGTYVGATLSAGTAALGANGNGDTLNTEGVMISVSTAGYEVGQQ